MKKTAIKCKKCGSIIFSRATHDFRWCACNSIAIDGGSDYTRIIGNPKNIESIVFDIEQTEKELYDDWNTNTDKYGLIKNKIDGKYWKACSECGGTGEYFTESMARYDDHGIICHRCGGGGIIEDWEMPNEPG